MAALPPIAVGFLLACVLMPGLAVFGLGETLATALGAWVKPTRVAAIVVSALLSGGAVSLVGPIGFVGLMAPNVWPSLHQRPSVGALILVALTGAGILLAADYLATGLLSPIELPTGAVTGLAGAPLFIWMVTRRNA
jgi:iron complex transport system permease protein